MCRQVRGQKKDQKVRAKVDKQEVEIRQRMTAASLAEAMNKDFGRTSPRRGGDVLRRSPLINVCLVRSRSRVGGSDEHLGGSGLPGAGLGPGGPVDQGGGDAIRDEVQMGQTERDPGKTQQRRPLQVRDRKSNRPVGRKQVVMSQMDVN